MWKTIFFNDVNYCSDDFSYRSLHIYDVIQTNVTDNPSEHITSDLFWFVVPIVYYGLLPVNPVRRKSL